jgi:hypothetical protein
MTVSIFDTSTVNVWQKAKKVQSILVKPVSQLFESTILTKVLLNTIEGVAPIGQDNFICLGLTGDVWQQTEKALFKKYDFVSNDPNGWLVYSPKPENEVECFELIGDDIPEHNGYIVGHWGAKVDGIDNLQSFVGGDFLCRQTYDHTDQWIVKRGLFLNSYQILKG